MLICPIWHTPLERKEHTWECIHHHSFDVAKQGYVNLSMKQKKQQGDNKEMVKARTAFLEQGYYDFLKAQVVKIIQSYHLKTIVDTGCGQGYYTSAVSKVCDVWGIDLSKDAIQYAAKKDKLGQYIVASIFSMPLQSNGCDGVLSIFVPYATNEIRRIIKTNGIWITVGPGPHHCWELKEMLYEHVKENPMPNPKQKGFSHEEQKIITSKQWVDDVWDLLEMTPYRYKSPIDGLQRVKACTGKEITFEFVIDVWRKL